MCGRFALTAPASTITEIFQIDVLPEILPRYNIAPTQDVHCVVEELGERKVEPFKWGLIPSWAKDRKIGYKTINARSETAATKPAFRAAFKRRRVLVLADGFYEWKRKGKLKLPWLMQVDGGKPYGMAGLWDTWVDPDTLEEVRSCTILTCGPNELMTSIHERMPVILPEETWATWLDPRMNDVATLQEMMQPFPADRMSARRVNTWVNNARNSGPDCQAPPEDEEAS